MPKGTGILRRVFQEGLCCWIIIPLLPSSLSGDIFFHTHIAVKTTTFKYFLEEIGNQNGNYLCRMRSAESLSVLAITSGI